MNLEKQVVSLDLAKRLKELGVKQTSYFWWYRIWNDTYELGDTREQMEQGKQVGSLHTTDARPIWDTFSAFTVPEIGKMLLPSRTFKNRRFVAERLTAIPTPESIFNPNYWASTLVYLIEHNLITL